MATDDEIYYDMPPYDMPPLDQPTPESTFVDRVLKGKGWAEQQKELRKAAKIDPFTGWRLDFDPEEPRHWGGAPPALPGVSPDRQMHHARGRKDGPLYTTPNIMPSDPAWIKFAYMRYPLDREALAGLLEEMMPVAFSKGRRSTLLSTASPQRLEFAAWPAELIMLYQLTGHQVAFDLGLDETIGEDIIRLVLPAMSNSGNFDGRNLLQPWRDFQRLVVFVLWICGTQHRILLQRDFYSPVTEHVIRIWQATHPKQINFTVVANAMDRRPRPRRVDMEEDRDGFARRRESRNPFPALWTYGVKVASVAKIVEGLYWAIGSSGYTVGACPNCNRFLGREDERKIFCSPNCRTTYNRKRPAEALSAAAKRKEQEWKRKERQKREEEDPSYVFEF